MQTFWKWLMRANARGVCAGALLILALVIAWWIWREFAPPPRGVSVPPGAAGRLTQAGLGVREFIERETSPAATLLRGNPFLLMGLVRPPVVFRHVIIAPPEFVAPPPDERLAAIGARDGEWRKPRILEGMPAPPAIPSAPPPAVPLPPEVQLTYRGVFKKPDGRVAVLVEDSISGKASFYPVGARLHGVQFGRPDARQLAIRMSDGRSGVLKFGDPGDFRGGRHVD